MGNDNKNSIGLDELLKIIDSYKTSRIYGERVELIIYPRVVSIEDTQKDERVISIGKQDGFARDRKTFIFENGELFDKELLPEIIERYTDLDPMKKWSIKTPEIEGATIKGSTTTASGNLLYLDTFNEKLYQEISPKSDRMKQLNASHNSDEIWNIILRYAYVKREVRNFFKLNGFKDEDLSLIGGFAVNLAENEDEIVSRSTKETRKENEKAVSNIISKITMIRPGEVLLQRIKNSSTNIREFECLARAEKDARSGIEFSDDQIQRKINFVETTLEAAGYFDNINASLAPDYSSTIAEDKKNIVKKILDTSEDEYTTKYCNELIGFIDRTRIRNDRNYNYSVTNQGFMPYDEVIIDSYEELEAALALIRGAMLHGERYEIVVDESKERTKVRIDLLDGPTRRDAFEFEFTDKEELSRRLNTLMEQIYVEEPRCLKTILYNTKEQTKGTYSVLTSTRDDNDFLAIGEKPKDLEGVDEETLMNFWKQVEEYNSPQKEKQTAEEKTEYSSSDIEEAGVNCLFEVIKQAEEKDEPDYITEIKEAYQTALNLSTEGNPASMKLVFDKDFKGNADVVISNREGSQDIIIYQRTYDIDVITDELMPVLRGLYVNDNTVDYNVLYGVDGTDDYCLLVVDTDRNMFSIVNAEESFAKNNQSIITTMMREAQEDRERRAAIKLV